MTIPHHVCYCNILLQRFASYVPTGVIRRDPSMLTCMGTGSGAPTHVRVRRSATRYHVRMNTYLYAKPLFKPQRWMKHHSHALLPEPANQRTSRILIGSYLPTTDQSEFTYDSIGYHPHTRLTNHMRPTPLWVQQQRLPYIAYHHALFCVCATPSLEHFYRFSDFPLQSMAFSH